MGIGFGQTFFLNGWLLNKSKPLELYSCFSILVIYAHLGHGIVLIVMHLRFSQNQYFGWRQSSSSNE